MKEETFQTLFPEVFKIEKEVNSKVEELQKLHAKYNGILYAIRHCTEEFNEERSKELDERERLLDIKERMLKEMKEDLEDKTAAIIITKQEFAELLLKVRDL